MGYLKMVPMQPGGSEWRIVLQDSFPNYYWMTGMEKSSWTGRVGMAIII